MKNAAAASKIALALSLALAGGSAAAADCTATPVDGKDGEYAVHDESATYRGYVAEEPNGSWFAWVAGKGASNRTYGSKEEAVSAVCEAG